MSERERTLRIGKTLIKSGEGIFIFTELKTKYRDWAFLFILIIFSFLLYK